VIMMDFSVNEPKSKLKTVPDKYREGFLGEFDRRTEIYHTLNAAYTEVMSDMGGQDTLSHVQVSLVERFIFLEYVMRDLEQRIVKNPKKSDELLGRWIQAINTLTGLAKTIGLKRRAKKIASLESYVKTKSRVKRRKTG
jgi:hypothetical protein